MNTRRSDIPPAPGGRRRGVTAVLSALAVYLGGALVILLSPTSPAELVAATTTWLRDLGLGAVRQGWVEFAANIALFAPLGVLLTLGFRRSWAGIAAATVVSATVELGQLLLPHRTASIRDVFANVLGAATGAALVLALRAGRRRRETIRRTRRQAHTPLVPSPKGHPTHTVEPWSAP
ncbi:MAG: VanZ family protein [Microbacterium sp.]|uniref:VanZ family protein n=1 Tax=Microbacterium sp. TaxID=51671 RepID=UPI00261D0209|nr:VanZ family protein [Microbacterium sp.]MCX6502432.1 VanZ family protein [Microbacterium sp.]